MAWHDLPDLNLNNLGLIVCYLQYKSWYCVWLRGCYDVDTPPPRAEHLHLLPAAETVWCLIKSEHLRLEGAEWFFSNFVPVDQ